MPSIQVRSGWCFATVFPGKLASGEKHQTRDFFQMGPIFGEDQTRSKSMVTLRDLPEITVHCLVIDNWIRSATKW